METLLVIFFIGSWLAAINLAESKGRSTGMACLAGCLFGPLAWIYYATVPSAKVPPPAAPMPIQSLVDTTCPHCDAPLPVGHLGIPTPDGQLAHPKCQASADRAAGRHRAAVRTKSTHPGADGGCIGLLVVLIIAWMLFEYLVTLVAPS